MVSTLNILLVIITIWISVTLLITIISDWRFWISFTNCSFWSFFISHSNITIVTVWYVSFYPFIFTIFFAATLRWFFTLVIIFFIRLITIITSWANLTGSTAINLMITRFLNTSITIWISFTSRLLTFFINFFIAIITIWIIMGFCFAIITIYCLTICTFRDGCIILFFICIRNITIWTCCILFGFIYKNMKDKLN